MKVALLAAGTSVHAVRWAEGLAAIGVEVSLVTQHPPLRPLDARVRIELLPHRGPLGYLRNAAAVQSVLRRARPDLLNAHYASGYGTLARRAGFRPTLLSVWGSDVFEFPDRSPLHRWWMRGTLRWATGIASTSEAMARRVRELVPDAPRLLVTPFGVDVARFHPRERDESDRPAEPLVIGTVKTMSDTYGIDLLIAAFALILRDPSVPPDVAASLRLRLVGGGPDLERYRALARGLEVEPQVEFCGPVPHDEVPIVLREFDIFVALSRAESFGVAVLEASAAGLPVIVSDAGGLPEVVLAGETGLVVPAGEVDEAARALRQLVTDPEMRRRLGRAGRVRVEERFAWSASLRTMCEAYRRTIDATD